MADLPSAAVRDGITALKDFDWIAFVNGAVDEEQIVRLVLDAAMPGLRRSVGMQLAKQILELAAADRKFPPRSEFNHPPYGDLDSSVRKLARGRPLPSMEELRGGRGDLLSDFER